MTSPQQQRGNRFERELVDYLRAHGFPEACRKRGTGTLDEGDIAGVPGWLLEAKATKAADLGSQLTEAEKEAANAGLLRFALIKRRRRRPTAEAFAIVPLWLLVELIGEPG